MFELIIRLTMVVFNPNVSCKLYLYLSI